MWGFFVMMIAFTITLRDPTARLIVALLGLVLSAAALQCPSQSTTAKLDSKPRPSGNTGKKRQSEPCETPSKDAESQPAGTVSWDPVVCWDCPTPGEPVAFFVVGLALSVPIFLLIRRVKTRKRESKQPQRLLDL